MIFVSMNKMITIIHTQKHTVYLERHIQEPQNHIQFFLVYSTYTCYISREEKPTGISVI